MAKYSEQFKRQVVRAYLEGDDSYSAVAQAHSLTRSQVTHWVNCYRAHGDAGLCRQSGRYSAAFKQAVLLRIRREGISDAEAAILLGIRSSGHIAKWRAQYTAGGIEALAHKRRGGAVPRKKPLKPDPSKMTEEELREEVANLRTELDYLKKLDALIQAEQTEALAGKRKWSKD